MVSEKDDTSPTLIYALINTLIICIYKDFYWSINDFYSSKSSQEIWEEKRNNKSKWTIELFKPQTPH